MVKKLILSVLAVTLAMSQPAYALRPMATSKHDNALIMVKGRMDEFIKRLKRYAINIIQLRAHLPAIIKTSDDTLRDGLQSQEVTLIIGDKLRLFDAIMASGVDCQESGSFVNPKIYPQLQTSGEVAAYSFQEYSKAKLSKLIRWLLFNKRSWQDLLKAWESVSGAPSKIAISVQTAADPEYVISNFYIDDDDVKAQIRSGDILKMFRKYTVPVLDSIREWERDNGRDVLKHGYISNVPKYEGREIKDELLLEIIREFKKQGITMIWLSDTTGEAEPDDVRRISKFVFELSKKPEFANLTFGWHIHDRGLGLVNMLVAAAEGITWFDTCLGGIGGSKAAVGASANVSTEDWIALLQALGVKVNADLDKLLSVTKKLEEILGKDLAREPCLWGLHKLTPDERIEALAYLKSKLGLGSKAEKAKTATKQGIQLERHFETCA